MSIQPVDIVGVGAVTWDRFLVVPRYPGPDEKIRAIRAEESAGGNVATALVALRRWGLKGRLVASVGFDEYSFRIIEDLLAERIEINSLIRREDADGRRTTILVDNRNGQRCIISGPHRVPPITPDQIDPQWFQQARVLHLDTSVDECGVEIAKLAKEAGMWVILDAETLGPRTPELMRWCDYIIAPIAFAQQCTGQEKSSRAAYALHLQTGKAVLLTDGSRGCEFVQGENTFHQPAYPVPVVDSTGAGDVFHAAFIYGLLAAYDIRKTVRLAAWAAAEACKELGGRKGIPSLEAIHEFCHKDGEGRLPPENSVG